MMNLYEVVFVGRPVSLEFVDMAIARVEMTIIGSDHDAVYRFMSDYKVVHWPGMRLHEVNLIGPYRCGKCQEGDPKECRDPLMCNGPIPSRG